MGRPRITNKSNDDIPFQSKPIGWKMVSTSYFADLTNNILPISAAAVQSTFQPPFTHLESAQYRLQLD